MTTPPGAPPAAAGRGGGLAALARRKPALVFGAAGIAGVAALALYKKSSGSSAGTPAASTAADTTGTGYADTGTATPYSYSGYGGDTGYQTDMLSLQQQLQAATSQISTLDTLTVNEQKSIYALQHPKPKPKPKKPKPKPKPKRKILPPPRKRPA